MIDDNTILWFGKHQGLKLIDVPSGWMLWYVKQDKINEALKTYILNKKSQLEMQSIADKQQEKAQRILNSK